MPLPMITAVGNLTSDPELTFTPTGTARVKLSVACNDRKKNPTTGEYEDGDTTFIDVTAWRNTAENAAESLKKGDAVIVTGRLKMRTYEKRDGSKGVSVEIDADTIAASIARNPVTVQRQQRANGPTFGHLVTDEWGGPAPF